MNKIYLSFLGLFIKVTLRMSKTTDDKYDGFCSKINNKPVDAIGHIKFSFDFDIFKSEFYVEKVFGLIVQGTN